MECSHELIGMVIDTRGIPGRFQLLKGCGYGFDEMAVAATRMWRYVPASLNGSPVAVAARVDVNFRLLPPYSTANEGTPEKSKQVGELARKGREALSQHNYLEA